MKNETLGLFLHPVVVYLFEPLFVSLLIPRPALGEAVVIDKLQHSFIHVALVSGRQIGSVNKLERHLSTLICHLGKQPHTKQAAPSATNATIMKIKVRFTILTPIFLALFLFAPPGRH